ncbi:hypothetical protein METBISCDRAFT_18238, partial [Metschnikowia bicuspidata]
MTTYASFSKAAEEKATGAIIDAVCAAAPEDLALVLEAHLVWNRPPGDLLQWTAALNRIDSVLEDKIRAYGLDKPHPRPTLMAPTDTKLVVACLEFSHTLLRNCTSTAVYLSQERVFQLCACGDTEIVLEAMAVALRFASVLRSTAKHRFPPTKQARQHFLQVAKFYPPLMPASFVQKTALRSASATESSASASSESAKYEHYSLSDSLDASKKYPARWRALNFQYYAAPGGKTPQKGPERKKNKHADGVFSICVPEEKVGAMKLQQLFDLATAHDLPAEYNAPFLLGCLNAKAFSSTLAECMHMRATLVRIKCLAFLAVCCFCSTDFASTNLFEAEPYTFGFMVDLVSPLNTHLPRAVFNTLAASLLAIAAKRVWGTEIVRLMGGNVRHGLLYQLIKHVGRLVREDATEARDDGYYAFFEMLETLVHTRVVTTRLAAGGLLVDLVDFLAIPTDHKALGIVVASILTNLFEHSAENIALFADNNGFTALVNVISRGVDSAISSAERVPASSRGGSRSSAQQLEFVGNVLLALYTLVESDLGDRLQNLLDSPILGTFTRIFDHVDALGEFVTISALNVVCKTLHNEPTAYAMLHESGVVDAIVRNYARFFGPAFDSPSVVVDILGALSLNHAGLRMIQDRGLLLVFFRSFLDAAKAREMLADDAPNTLAVAVEELSRHFPLYQPVVVEEILGIVQRLAAMEGERALRFYTDAGGSYYESSEDAEMKEETDIEDVGKKEEDDTWALLNVSAVHDCFLTFCNNLIYENKAWAARIADAKPFVLWMELMLVGNLFDYTASASYKALRNVARFGSATDRLYAFVPVLHASVAALCSPEVARFALHPVEHRFLAEMARDTNMASATLAALHRLLRPLAILSAVFLDHFDGHMGQTRELIRVLNDTPETVDAVAAVLRKCAAEQAHVLANTPARVLAATHPFLAASDWLGFTTQPRGDKTALSGSARDKNTAQYRS